MEASSYTPSFRPFGLTLTIKTDLGIVGFKSHWGGHQLCIIYPKTCPISEQELKKMMKKMTAQSNSNGHTPDLKPASPSNPSRFLIIDPRGSNDTCIFKTVRENGRIQNILCSSSGYSVICHFILAGSTNNFAVAFDPKIARIPVYQFLTLTCDIVNTLGGAQTISIGYNGLLTTELLSHLGYTGNRIRTCLYLIRFLFRVSAEKLLRLKLPGGRRERYSAVLRTITKQSENKERIILDTAEDPHNWIPLDTIRHIKLNSAITPKQLFTYFFF